MSDWLPALAKLDAAGKAAVLVTVLEGRGSTPREAGCKMVIAAAEMHGTIGGGRLEHKAVEIAHQMLVDKSAGDPPEIREFALGPSLGQCCGGSATLLFELVFPPSIQIALFGAGHVGRALVNVMAELPYRITWIDPRDDAYPATVPANTKILISKTPEDEVADLPPGSYVLVMTHSHPLDLRIVAAALRRGDLRYVGLIGSRTKRARFAMRLARRGLNAEAIAQLTCPIGLEGIDGKHPAEIAISVAAQIMQIAGPTGRSDTAPANVYPLDAGISAAGAAG